MPPIHWIPASAGMTFEFSNVNNPNSHGLELFWTPAKKDGFRSAQGLAGPVDLKNI